MGPACAGRAWALHGLSASPVCVHAALQHWAPCGCSRWLSLPRGFQPVGGCAACCLRRVFAPRSLGCNGRVHDQPAYAQGPPRPPPPASFPQVLPMDGRVSICQELTDHTLRCVRDQNGNHVVQARAGMSAPRLLQRARLNRIGSRGRIKRISTLGWPGPCPCGPGSDPLPACLSSLHLQKCIECVQPSDPARAMIEVRPMPAPPPVPALSSCLVAGQPASTYVGPCRCQGARENKLVPCHLSGVGL